MTDDEKALSLILADGARRTMTTSECIEAATALVTHVAVCETHSKPYTEEGRERARRPMVSTASLVVLLVGQRVLAHLDDSNARCLVEGMMQTASARLGELGRTIPEPDANAPMSDADVERALHRIDQEMQRRRAAVANP